MRSDETHGQSGAQNGAQSGAQSGSPAPAEVADEVSAEKAELLEKLEALMLVLGGGVALIDRDHRVVYYGKPYEEWFGPLGENKGKPCYQAFCRRAKQCIGWPAREWFSRGAEPAGSVESEIVTVRGEKRRVRFIVLPIRGCSGNIDCVLEVAEDVTDKIAAEKDLRRRNRELTTLNRVAAILSSSFLLDRALPAALGAILKGFGIEAGCIWLCDEQASSFRLAASRGLPDAAMQTQDVIRPDDPLALVACRRKECLRLVEEDFAAGGSVMNAWPRLGITSAVVMPLQLLTRTLGFLCVFGKSRALPDLSAICLQLKSHLYSAVENSRLFGKLTQSEETCRQFFDASADAIFVVGPDLKILDANPQASRRVGYARKELIGMDATKLVSPEYHNMIAPNVASVRAGEYLLVEIEEVHKDGSRLPVELSAAKSAYKGADVVLIISRDISDRKAAERELRRTVKLTQTVTDAITSVDMERKIVSWNPGAEKMFGYTADELIGQSIFVLFRPEDREKVREETPRRITERGTVQDEWVMVKKNGETMNVLRSISPLVDDKGNLEGFVGFLKDITELKQTQEQLFQAQKIESIGTLAGGIAHDFNNILSGILGRASFLKDAVPPGSPLYGDIEGIENSAKRAAGLTRQLLGFARGGRYQPQPLNLNEVISETLDMVSRTMAKSILVQKHLQPDVWGVEADRTQMQQVIMNLCINSRDAMPEGGTLLVESNNVELAEDDAKRVYFSARPGRYVRVSVTDTGVGMDERTRERAFGPFFSTKGGSGLGLSMVYGIIQNHKGFITLYSEPGKGTTIRFYLPAIEAVAEQEAAPEKEAVAGEGTILVVDDEPALQEVLSRMLERLGYRVLVAGSGEDALKAYAEHSGEIDLVLLDMIMPGMPGKAVFDRLREIDAGVKVLLSSGFAETRAAVQAQQQGALGFLEKPYIMSELSAAVRRALKK